MSIVKKILLIAGPVLSVVGMLLAMAGVTSVPSNCWGHLGCDYYVRHLGYLSYVGILLLGVGLISFFEALLFTKTAILSRILLAIGIVLMLLIFVAYLSPMVFINRL